MTSVPPEPAATLPEAGTVADRRASLRGAPEGSAAARLIVGSKLLSGVLWDESHSGGRVYFEREDDQSVRQALSAALLGHSSLRLDLEGRGSSTVRLVWYGMTSQGGVVVGVEFTVPREPRGSIQAAELPPMTVYAVRHRPRREAELAILLGDFFRQLSGEDLSLDSALEILCQKALSLAGAEGVLFFVIDHGEFVARAQAGRWRLDPGSTLPRGGKMDIPDFASLKKALQRGFQLFANHASRSVFAEHPGVRSLGLQSVMIIPVFGREVDFGVLIFGHSSNPNAFGAQEQAEAEIFANQAALFLEKAQLVKSLQEWSKFLEAMNRISLALHQRLHLDQVLHVICAESLALFHVDIARVFLAENGEFELKAAAGEPDMRIRISYSDLVDARLDPPVDCFVNHFQSFPPEARDFMKGCVPHGDVQSFMVIGLFDQGEIIGALGLGDLKNPERFGPQELQKGKLVAEQATRAIVNSRLYERVAQSQRMIRQQDRFRILGELAGVISHEIKNALVPLRTLVDLLPHRYDDASFRDWYAKTVRQEVDRMHALVTQLSRFRSAENRMIEPTDPVALLKGVVELMKPEAIARQITLEFHGDSLPLMPMVQNEMRQVLLNLILNAIQAVEEKGTVRVGVRHEESDDEIHFWISDSGPGISPGDLERIFDPLFTTKKNGSGLGLAVARDLVQGHGGSIRAESKPGEGTTFTVVLPGGQGVGSPSPSSSPSE